MSATEESGEEALYVLTAVLLTPAQFPSVLGDDYPEACAALGLEPYADGLRAGAGAGRRRRPLDGGHRRRIAGGVRHRVMGLRHGVRRCRPTSRTVVAALPGWPLAVAVAAPGVPAPHDPAPELSPGDGPAAARTAGHRAVGSGAAAARRGRDRAPVGDVARADRRAT